MKVEPTHQPGTADRRDAMFSTAGLSHDSLSGRATRGAVLTVLSTGVKIAVQFGSIAILARLVPPGEFGVVAMAMPIVAIAVSLSRFGLSQAIMQRSDVSHALATTLFWANLGLASVIGLTVLLLSPLAATFYADARVSGVFAALTLSILFGGAVTQYVAILRRQMRFKAVEACMLAAEIAAMAAAVIAAALGASYWAIVLQHVLLQGVALAALTIATGWLPSSPPLTAAHWRQARSSLALGGYLAGFGLLNQIMHGLGTVISGRMLGDVAAASYFRAWTLGYFPEGRIGSPLAGVFIPSLSRAKDTPETFEKLYTTLLRRLSLFVMPVGAVFLAGGDTIVAILLGPEWTAAQPLLMWLGLMVLQAPLSTSLNWALTASGATRLLMQHGMLSLALVGGALMAGAAHGLVAMTAAYALTGLLLQGSSMLWFAHRGTTLRIGRVAARYARDVAVFLCIAGAAYAVRTVLEPVPPVLELLAVGTIVGVGSLGYGFADPLLRADLVGILKQILPKRLTRSL